MNIMLTGASGILGGSFLAALQGHTITVLGRDMLDVSNPESIVAHIAAVKPDVLINCAADTDAEGAERDASVCQAVNAVLPGILAKACDGIGALMVHFSSTGCYGVTKTSPYTEDDIPNPTTTHHRAKIAGEKAVQAMGSNYLILRTGWLFGGTPKHRKNFVWQRLLEACGKERLLSDGAQYGNPTYVGDVVRQTLKLIDVKALGVFNVVNVGTASRFDYVTAIIKFSGLSCLVERSEKPFVRLAPVSSNEMALNAKLEAMGLAIMPAWQESLRFFTEQLVKSQEWRTITVKQGAARA